MIVILKFKLNQPKKNILGLRLTILLIGVVVAGVYNLTKYHAYQTNVVAASVAPVNTPIDAKLGYRIPPKKHILPGAVWVPQTYNNCAPATVAMLLQYFGHQVPQTVTKAALRTNPSDSNVFAFEIKDYLKSEYALESKLFFNGSVERMKILIANGFYVIVENWLHPNEDIGHNTIIRGYDDDLGVFVADDSYIGANVTYRYEEFDQTRWKPFNREYLPVYQLANEVILKAIVGDDWEEKKMYEAAVETSRIEINKNQDDMYAWFNLGSSYFGLGDYRSAKTAYEQARTIGWPRRMLWYQYQPVQTYNRLGEPKKALALIAEGLRGNKSFAELHYEAALAYQALGDLTRAKSEVGLALTYAPKFAPARELAERLN